MKRNEADSFLQGYIDAALFTTDPDAPGGCDYVECGRAGDLWPSLPDWWIDEAKQDCAKFTAQNAELLNKAGDCWQNGSDFWYTRNHHGVGFWDRGYPDDVADPLTKAAHNFGEHYLLAEDFGLVTKD